MPFRRRLDPRSFNGEAQSARGPFRQFACRHLLLARSRQHQRQKDERGEHRVRETSRKARPFQNCHWRAPLVTFAKLLHHDFYELRLARIDLKAADIFAVAIDGSRNILASRENMGRECARAFLHDFAACR